MEAISGTKDPLTGIATALMANDMPVPMAVEVAAKTNRLAGFYANPTPASLIVEVIHQIPRALAEVLKRFGDTLFHGSTVEDANQLFKIINPHQELQRNN
ncbi:MAG: hypothetical protein RBR67_10850 [Desulfobacterium sp.]|jgi:hypothetical protein|nr:hypothetical protein [Desulfobacterium sp.]